MAYEVVKRVGGRAYRYSVESYRDPESKKVRAHWTYLGTAPAREAQAVPVARRVAAGDTRARLLDAFERLLERQAYATVTAGAVASEAGLAHGTFYRYFRDKASLLHGALGRIREEIDRARPTFEPPYGSLADERARIRGWLQATFERPASRPGVMRAYYDALALDPDLQARRSERSRANVATLRRYFEGLVRADTIALSEPEEVARALILLLEAAFRAQVVEAKTPDDVTIAGVVRVFERAILG